MKPEINGNARFTAFQQNKDGSYLLCFYENKDEIGNLDKSVGIIKFASFVSFGQWLALQVHLHNQINQALSEHTANKGH